MGQVAGATPAGSTTTSPSTTPSTTSPSTTPSTTSSPSTTSPGFSVPPGTTFIRPPGVATTAPTTVPGSATTTTIPLPVFATVSPPPHALPVPADPKKIALAAHLARLITAQAATLDKLAVSYGQAQAVAQQALDLTTSVTSKLHESQARELAAQAATRAARSALSSAAISAYLGVRPVPQIASGQIDPIYQAGLAHVYSNNVVGTVNDRVQVFRAAQRRMGELRKVVEQETHAAHDAQALAAEGVAKAQAAIDAAAAVQVKLTAALAKVQAELVALVAAQRAGIAWQTYSQLGGGKALDFVPPKPLPALVPQTAAAIALVTAQMGKPYLWGGTGPDSFDCSGLMQWSWNQLGLQLPRVAADQQAWAIPVPISLLLPGDLVFFGSPAHHVGLYIGNGMMVDAPHTGAFVETVPVWWDELSGFGRVHT
jgi:peptidoglycan DL-endopeptidase CwlO